MTGSPVAEEAAKLVAALQDWFASASAGLPLATESTECTMCPFCQLLRSARSVRPEVFEHLAGAGAELVAALRASVEGAESSWRANRDGPLEHIHVGD